MGSTYAAGLAEAVDDGQASLRMAIGANLSSNHYPPIPGAYVEPVLKAIEAYQGGEHEADIDLTSIQETGMIPQRARLDDDAVLVISASDLLEITHSWGFVQADDGWDDGDDLDWDNQGVGDLDDGDDIDDDAYHGPRHPSDYLPRGDE